MQVLFLSLVVIEDISERGIYTDLLRQFVQHGHFVRVVSPVYPGHTENIQKGNYAILKVRTLQMQKANFIKKGVASLQIGPNIKRALKQYCGNEHYDLILAATPPITIAGTVDWVKRRDGAKVYLLLKDIWPQAIADLGAISKSGLVYRYYRSKEQKIYTLADQIGCMSSANVNYLLSHNPEVDPSQVEVCPNSIEPLEEPAPEEEKRRMLREKYGVPADRTVFLYGGNLGRPQGISFIIDALRACSEKENRFFVICGTGTEYPKLKAYVDAERPQNVLLINGLPKEEYDALASACDVGLLFLDYRFTIPNFPSRLLSYMQAGLPVLSCTDPNTDVGDVIEAGGFGWKCYSNDMDIFCQTVDAACESD